MCTVRKMRFCNAFSSFDVTLVVSFVKECFRLQIKGKFYINRKFFGPLRYLDGEYRNTLQGRLWPVGRVTRSKN